MTENSLNKYFVERVNEYLSESPQIIYNLDPKYKKFELYDIIDLAKTNNKFHKTNNDNFLVYPISKSGSLYVLLNDSKDIIGATRVVVSFPKFEFGTLYYPKISQKFDKSESNVLLKLYSFIEKNANCLIMCNKEQTEDSMIVWKKWIKNPSRYNVEQWWCINIETGKIKELDHDSIDFAWGEKDIFQKYRFVIKFK